VAEKVQKKCRKDVVEICGARGALFFEVKKTHRRGLSRLEARAARRAERLIP
jgi:hypothetical protein